MSEETKKANHLYLSNIEAIQKEFKWLNSDQEEDIQTIPTSAVNVIIGANNARKSRFMRYLLNQEHYFFVEKEYPTILNKLISELDKFSAQEFSTHIKYTWNSIFHDLKIKYPNLKNDFDVILKLHKKLDDIKEESEIDAEATTLFSSQNLVDLKKEINSINTHYSNTIHKALNGKLERIIIILEFLIKFDYIDGHISGTTGSSFNFNISADSLYKYVDLESNNSHTPTSKLNLQLSIKEYLDQNFTFNTKSISEGKQNTYIPTLRGTTALQGNSNREIYVNTIREKYTIPEWIQISTGLDLYTQVKKARNSKREIRKRFEAFEAFVGKTFFKGQSIDIVAEEGQEHLLLHIENETNDREFHHLGSGIQSLIILLYPLFMANEGDWFFIEEPELNMHPGMQSLFMHTLLNNEVIKEKNLTTFLTTHSNHLLDTLLFEHEDCSILSFENKTDQDKSTYTLVHSLLSPSNEALDLLGVSNSSVFMANCAIWVEGVSDRRYLKAFLLAYQKAQQEAYFIENVHYAFFEYAGSNLAHYDFDNEKINNEEEEQIKAYFLSNKIFLLADKDEDKGNGKSKSEKHETLTDLSRNNNYFDYIHTGALEIENVLSPTILKKVFIEVLEEDTQAVQQLDFKYSDYHSIAMGKYIRQTLKLVNRKIGEKTLTTDYKNKFSSYVLEQVEKGKITWTNIKEHPSAENITIALRKFLEKHNPPLPQDN